MSQNIYTIKNPYTDQYLDEFSFADQDQVNEVVRKLSGAKAIQSSFSPFERAEILRQLVDLLSRNHEELANTVTIETGKTIRDSRIEVQRAINTMISASEEARRIDGELLHSDAFPPKRDKYGLVTWAPVGVVLAITPFNFPVNIPAHKIGPAFAAGNTIFFKPSPQNYLSAKFFTRMCYDAGIPEDVIQLCVPDILELTELIQNPFINCINFTGSVKAGKAISQITGFKKLIFELGGNDPLIVMNDADLDHAVQTAIDQRFGTAGQRCTAAKRIFIHQKVYGDFVDLLVEKTSLLVVGDPQSEITDVGPVISQEAADKVMHTISEAVDLGAKVLKGHKNEKNLIHPTILENVPDHAKLVCEETFGPVMPLREFSSLDEIITLVNQQQYGLQAGIFTQNIKTAKYLFKHLEVGTLAVNDGPGFRAEHFPFGGIKSSGIGREGVRYAIREMSIQKTLVI